MRQYTDIWLGGTNLGYNDQFIWISNGKPVLSIDNDKFPVPYYWHGNNANCLLYSVGGKLSDSKWYAEDCNQKRKFVCESQ